MGARFEQEHGVLRARADRLHGAIVSLDFPSVGATENVMMAGVAARGTTVIENAAREPELSDLADFLTAMGARIEGVGTPTIEIEGVDTFTPVEHRVIPDRIEAGTFAIAACATQGEVVLQGARSDHMDLVLSKLAETGADILATEDGLAVSMADRPRCVDLVTLPYPGFPTDLQPQMMAMLSAAGGTSIVTENVFESRFMFVDELNRMGADIRTEGHHAVIRGVGRLSAAPVRALDIRAGAAMVIAALAADGVTGVEDMYHVDRGYEDFEAKLTALGAVSDASGSSRRPCREPGRRAASPRPARVVRVPPVGVPTRARAAGSEWPRGVPRGRRRRHDGGAPFGRGVPVPRDRGWGGAPFGPAPAPRDPAVPHRRCRRSFSVAPRSCHRPHL
jgi:UDP-N-acetylglucosamine 1-carboxyvinyltransferase